MRAFRWIVCCSTVCAVACGASRIVLSEDEQQALPRRSVCVPPPVAAETVDDVAPVVTFTTPAEPPPITALASGVRLTDALVGDPEFWGEVGALHLAAREQAPATRCFLQAHRLAPEAGWLDRLDTMDATVVAAPLNRLSRERVDDPLVTVKLAQVYARLGLTAEANALYLQLLSRDVRHAALLPLDELPAEELLMTLQQLDAAVPSPETLRLLLERYLRAGLGNAAVVTIQRRIAAGVGPDLWGVLAEAHLALSQPGRAANALELAYAATGEVHWLQALDALDPGRAVRRLTPRTVQCECTSPENVALRR